MIAGPWGGSVCNFLRDLHTASRSGRSGRPSHQPCRTRPFLRSLRPCSCLCGTSLGPLCGGVAKGLICISLARSDAEPLCMGLLSVSGSVEERLSRPSADGLTGLLSLVHRFFTDLGY